MSCSDKTNASNLSRTFIPPPIGHTPKDHYNAPMISLFLGLTLANLLLLSMIFSLGLFAIDAAGKPTTFYAMHIALAIAGGMMVLLTHLGTFMYFMATSRWIEAASHKFDLPIEQFTRPALGRKRRAMATAMTAIMVTMLAMFIGAAVDPTVNPWWPPEVHLAAGVLAIMTNFVCATIEFRLLKAQAGLMKQTIAATGQTHDA